MKIENIKKSTIPISGIKIGELFKYGHGYYMRIMKESMLGSYPCVDVQTGKYIEFRSTTEVFYVDASIHINSVGLTIDMINSGIISGDTDDTDK